MENDDEREVTEPSPAVTRWTVGLTCVAVVATAFLVAGLLHEPEPELTTTPVTPTTSEPPAPAEYSYVTPPVTFPVQIPGCDVVEPPQQPRFFGMAYLGTPEYDNPSYPWFSGPKAGAMTQALQEALPAGVEIAFASVQRSLIFQPIPGDSTEHKEFGGWTNAQATLLRGDGAGGLTVTVRMSTTPIPPCVAGDLDERRHLPDGTIVDTDDTWHETNGVRTLSRTATAYLPDGSVAHASATDDARDGSGRTRAVPLTIDDLVALVTAPGLRVTAPVPPGTPNPPESCYGASESSAAIDQAQARKWNAVLAQMPLDGLTLDRPLGALLPASTGGVCQMVRVTTPGRQSQLGVTISTGQPLPQEPDTASNDGTVSRRLPDGTIVATSEWTTTSMEPSSSPGTTRSVTVTRPSGTQVRASSSGNPTETATFALLEEIALNPGLEVSR
ncbi:hypothetical protein [Nocardia goodfellowii]|uniref:DUF5642 domain-containing protein n=1 Tax=Nocardia goodfellowii TaxID=882446 RepID=A0ABS4QND0_9NOCA|nr:hypothetical protein [Nocardia goodfellowii]MBP2193214.1 hypothetical protein [Nocardia goodfellowii]